MANCASLVIVVCLAVIIGMHGAEAQNYPKVRKGQAPGKPPLNVDEDIWLIAINHFDSREEYLDPISGEIKGFDVDVINAVCEIAEKNCQFVEDLFSNCWDTSSGEGLGGVGLFNFYYDACTAWNPTYPRARVFQFTDSLIKNGGSSFIVAVGNPGNFDWTDLTGKTIGLVSGFVADSACVLRNADTITGPAETYVYYEGPNALRDAILRGDVDAGFDTRGIYPDTLEVVSDPVPCTMGGNAMMTRKDSPFKEWFDPALAELIDSDRYVEVCDNLDNEHALLPGPGPEICFGR